MRAATPLLVLSAALFSGCRPAPPFEHPSLCQLAEHREAYAGHVVEVEGELLVSRHGSVVSDPRCGYGVGISWFAGDVPNMREFDRVAALAQHEPIRVRVRVRGVMRQDERTGFRGERGWSLHMSQARVVAAVRLSEDDWSRYLRWFEGPSSEPFRPSQRPVPVPLLETPGSAR